MRRPLAVFLLFSTVYVGTAVAQTPGDWVRLRQYAHSIGVDSLCPQPDAACLTRYFTQLVYGRTPRRMGYQGVPGQIDTVRLYRLTHLFLIGADWCPLLDSMESHDRRYRQLTAYCLRCLIDDYLGDSLTVEQVHETLNTYRWLNRFSATQRVIVNIPSATLRLIDQRGETQFSSRVVVGKPSTPTPIFAAYIPSLIMYPYWTIPRSVLKEYLPKIRKNPSAALNQFGLQVLDTKGQLVDPSQVDWTVPASAFPYRLRQSTGCDNALGLLKFVINSPYDVYLHDTNARRAFTLENRFLSHGCVRVERPADLANRLLGYAQFKADYLTRCPIDASPRTIPLPHPVPVITTYNVLDVDDDGAIRVYPDRYGWWRLVL